MGGWAICRFFVRAVTTPLAAWPVTRKVWTFGRLFMLPILEVWLTLWRWRTPHGKWPRPYSILDNQRQLFLIAITPYKSVNNWLRKSRTIHRFWKNSLMTMQIKATSWPGTLIGPIWATMQLPC